MSWWHFGPRCSSFVYLIGEKKKKTRFQSCLTEFFQSWLPSLAAFPFAHTAEEESKEECNQVPLGLHRFLFFILFLFLANTLQYRC